MWLTILLIFTTMSIMRSGANITTGTLSATGVTREMKRITNGRTNKILVNNA